MKSESIFVPPSVQFSRRDELLKLENAPASAQQWNARINRINSLILTALLLTPLAALFAAEPSLVPGTPGTAPDYFCTWNVQGFACSYTNASDQADMMIEANLFGTGPNQNWLGFYPEVRADLTFLLDDAFDFPLGGGHNHPVRGSVELDAARFPSYRGTPAERLAKLSKDVKARGWRDLGLWICNSRPNVDELPIDSDTYWSERLAWSHQAGIGSWKVDWGIGIPGKPLWKFKVTPKGRAAAPGVWIEFGAQGDIYRTYDVAITVSIPETIRRIALFLGKQDPNDRRLINCEDEVYIGAGTGSSYGVMRHPLTGNMPNGNPDGFFTLHFRDVKHRIDEVTRATRWHRIAQPFAKGDAAIVDEVMLTDFKSKPAPARIARGGLALPTVTMSEGKEPPYVLCSRHPDGEIAVASIPRNPGANGKHSLVFPLADVTLDVGELNRPVGIFGEYSSLALVNASNLAGKRILAQDLAGKTPVNITAEVKVDGGRLTIPGTVIHRVGLMAAKPGDISDPGLVLVVEGLTKFVPKQPMKPGKNAAVPVKPKTTEPATQAARSVSPASSGPAIPYADALEAAQVEITGAAEKAIDNMRSRGLVVGNGEMNAIVCTPGDCSMRSLFIGLVCLGGLVSMGHAEHVVARFRDIPVLYETDVVVAGGSSAAAAAACAAADRGAQVVLIAPRPYVGDDLCGRQHLWLAEGESPQSALARALFPDGRVTTPLTVKNALDQALLKRSIRYLTGCYATDLLVDEHGRASGVVMVSRSGSQAIKAKVVIDASRHALLARQAGARFRAFVPGEKDFRFVVVGGALQSGPGLTARTLDVFYRNPGHGKNTDPVPVHEYAARISLADNSLASLARAEQAVRDLASAPGMQDCSEYAYCLPSDTLIADQRLDGNWPGGPACPVGVFRPKGIPRIYVLSEYADVAEKPQLGMVRPLSLLAVGELVGSAAAVEAGKLSHAAQVRLTDEPESAGAAVNVGEARNVTIPAGTATVVRDPKPVLPVLGQYDVVVVGGGTSGAPAGIAAARSGARTLVVEYLDELGGVGTAGMIGMYWYGQKDGFTKEIEAAIGGAKRWPTFKDHGWNVVQKSEWLRRELRKAGADIWFHSFGCGAVVEKGKVSGVVVATPFGRGVVLAKTVIDATGNADIADCAGAETQFGVAPGGMLSVQLAGYPHRNLGDNVNNTCFTMVDDTNVLDVWHLMASTRALLAKDARYDAGQLLDTRERRRIVADYMLTTPDILNHRTFPDTISHHKSNFDAAAFPTSPMLLVKDMKGPAFEVDLPYRSLLPKGLDGILVTGLGAGAERDAMTLVRMQADLQNQGYAAGAAAAMAATNGGHTRDIDIKKLQKQMVDAGVLAARVLTDKDSCPMGQESIEKAAAGVGSMAREIKQSRTIEDQSIFSLAVIMAHPEQSLPLLRKAYHAAASDETKLTYAQVLGILGDRTGAATLVSAVNGAAAWDKGFGLTTHRESDNTFSDLDRLVIALGASGAPEGLEAILTKLRQLESGSELSHFIAVAMALRHHAAPKGAAESLARLLNEPLFAAHAMADAVDPQHGAAAKRPTASDKPASALNAAFKEVLVAGMLVHCGDSQGLGRKVLEQYSKGVEGHFARYAQYVLRTAKDRTTQ